MDVFKTAAKCTWRHSRSWVIVLTPLVLLPLPFAWPDKAGRCAYAIVIMAVYWMTEALPIAATALLPVVLFPWLGVLGSKDICRNYLKDTNFLFLGGLLLAVAVERWNLHRRIALRVLLLVGSRPIFLMMGFMVVTAFLSMWLSNTATAAMMIPIAQAILTELKASAAAATVTESTAYENTGIELSSNGGQQQAESEKPMEAVVDIHDPHLTSNSQTNLTTPRISCNVHDGNVNDDDDSVGDKAHKMFSIALKLSIAYSANIGGMATLTGTGPNLVIKGQLDTIYGPSNGVNFSSWFIFAFPNMLLSLLLAWLWLAVTHLGPREIFTCCIKQRGEKDTSAEKVVRKEYEKLGPTTFAEIAVLIHFIVLALMWFSREPETFPGWGSLPFLTKGYVTDAATGVTISLLLFIVPSRRPTFWCFRKKTDSAPSEPVPALLDWDIVHKKMSWSVIIVLGGSFALADACEKSGLSTAIGAVFSNFTEIPVWALVMCLSLVTALFTEITSNTATATIFLPILAELAETIGVNPLYIMIPVAISCSFAFMLPVATPPNAIVFSYGGVHIMDMVKPGIMMNLVCIMVLQLSINTYGYAFFNLGEFPSWANSTLHNVALATSNSTSQF